jgi:2'-5' RNA ligase
MPGRHYAISYTPPPESPLARFGAGVLGYDCYYGIDVPYKAGGGLAPAILRLMTVEARRFGFHANFMTPFRLGDGAKDSLAIALERFAANHGVVPVGPLAVAVDGPRVVLRPVAQPAQLAELAASCLAAFLPLRAPAPVDGATRGPFRFSMTLAESVTGADLQAVSHALAAAFAPMAADHFELDAISLLREDDRRFRVVERWRLTGR